MARYQVQAPDGIEVCVATPYGVQVFKHGIIIEDARYASVYPNFFKLMHDDITPFFTPQVVEEPKVEEPEVEPQTSEPIVEKPKAEKVEKPKKAPAKKASLGKK